MSKFFKGLKKGLEEALAHSEGKITLKSEILEIPEPPAEYKAEDIKRIREQNHYSQGIFAKVLNVSIKTVQSWESGARVPSHAALRLLEIVDKGFYRPQIARLHNLGNGGRRQGKAKGAQATGQVCNSGILSRIKKI